MQPQRVLKFIITVWHVYVICNDKSRICDQDSLNLSSLSTLSLSFRFAFLLKNYRSNFNFQMVAPLLPIICCVQFISHLSLYYDFLLPKYSNIQV